MRTGRGTESDGSAYEIVVRDIDSGAPRVNAPLASPSSYVEFTFPANLALEYTLWMRLKTRNDHWANDSLWVQFTGWVNAAGLCCVGGRHDGGDGASVLLHSAEARTRRQSAARAAPWHLALISTDSHRSRMCGP